MNIPNLPTDNLYKFIAVAGLLAAGLGFTLPILSMRSIGMEIAEEMPKYADETTKQMDAAAKEFDEKEAKKLIDDAEKAEGRKLNPKERQGIVDIGKGVSVSGVAVGRFVQGMQGMTPKIQFLVDQHKETERLCKLAFRWGLGFAAFGFGLWFFRVQRYQDAIIRAEALQTEKTSHQQS